MGYLERACAKLGIDPERVMVCRESRDGIVVVVNNGIKGCPKYVIPIDELPEPVHATAGAQGLADERGIDLSGVVGTGHGGRIVKADVEAILEQDDEN